MELKGLEAFKRVAPDKKSTFEKKMGNNTSIMNFPAVRLWFETRTEDVPYPYLLLCSQNEKFKELFGKREGLFRNEYNISYWRVDFQGHRFTIFSGPGKGTAYEIEVDEVKHYNYQIMISDLEFTRVCIQFLEEIHELL